MTTKQLELKIIELYAEQDIVVGQLPYTDQFETMYEKALKHKQDLTRHQLWLILQYLSKRSRLELKVKKTNEQIMKDSNIKGFGL